MAAARPWHTLEINSNRRSESLHLLYNREIIRSLIPYATHMELTLHKIETKRNHRACWGVVGIPLLENKKLRTWIVWTSTVILYGHVYMLCCLFDFYLHWSFCVFSCPQICFWLLSISSLPWSAWSLCESRVLCTALYVSKMSCLGSSLVVRRPSPNVSECANERSTNVLIWYLRFSVD